MAKRKRRSIVPADNQTPDLTPRCEADGCTAALPLYGVRVPALPRRLWLCHQHYRYWLLDSMRAATRAWQKREEAARIARMEAWASRCSLLVRLEAEYGLGRMFLPMDWGARMRIGEVPAP